MSFELRVHLRQEVDGFTVILTLGVLTKPSAAQGVSSGDADVHAQGHVGIDQVLVVDRRLGDLLGRRPELSLLGETASSDGVAAPLRAGPFTQKT
ncbi:MAG: hypothetical protein H0U29_10535 [Acidimicrobiia bacterium]|nr:hypothetical protein [Acidimicrobiia bacterium]